MNVLVVSLTTFSIILWGLFNFAFTSAISPQLFRFKRELFFLILSLSIITNLSILLFFYSFFRTSVTSPGRIPEVPPWNLVSPSDTRHTTEAKRSGGPRYCRYERKYKPDRSHHCSQCQQCTLRMDHHCPWLDNCIGFWNYKFFLLTLVYGSLSLLLIAASCGWLGHFVMNHTLYEGIDISRMVIGIIISATSGVIACIVCLFLSIHLTMVVKGVTTIEVFEKQRTNDVTEDSCLGSICCEPKDPSTRKPLNPSIYRLPTTLQNFKAALGEDVLWWWFPSKPVMSSGSSDGLTYETMLKTIRKDIEDEVDSPLISKRD